MSAANTVNSYLPLIRVVQLAQGLVQRVVVVVADGINDALALFPQVLARLLAIGGGSIGVRAIVDAHLHRIAGLRDGDGDLPELVLVRAAQVGPLFQADVELRSDIGRDRLRDRFVMAVFTRR